MLAYYIHGAGLGSASWTHRAQVRQLLVEVREHLAKVDAATCPNAIRSLQRASYALGGAAAHAASIWSTDTDLQIALRDFRARLKMSWERARMRCLPGTYA